jgi:alpha-tubulin suppressor-like RCC1 family protein
VTHPLTLLFHARRTLPLMLTSLIAVAALACGEEPTTPAGPESAAPLRAATIAQPLSFVQVNASGYPGGADSHTCGVTSDGLAYCWGGNSLGELGIGNNSGPEECNTWFCSTHPVAVTGGLHFRHVSVGIAFTCGVTTDFRAFCWGRNFEGQLGNNTVEAWTGTPTEVAGGHQFRQIRAGDNHTCAITRTNVAYCWGWNGSGELGNGTTTQRSTPAPVAGGRSWLQLAGGYAHTCGVTTGHRAFCWGRNPSGQLGDGTTTNRSRPTAVSGTLPFEQIDAAWSHTCGVTTAGRAYCWGGNDAGQLGDGSKTNRLTPAPVFGQRLYDHLMAGFVHSCGVTRGGRGFCWGHGASGQLGNGRTVTRVIPTALGGNLSLAQLSAGDLFNCAVTTGHKAYCWGANFYGQLGDGTVQQRLLPVSVSPPS